MNMIYKLALASPALVALAACWPDKNVTETQTNSQETLCGTEKFSILIGKDASILKEQIVLPSGARIIFPGTPVTKDLRPDRLNVFVDGTNKIVRLNCG